MSEIIAGRLWQASGWIDGAAPGITWLPAQFPGRLRINAYALRDGEEWIGIDTGLPVHWDTIREGLAPSLPGTTRRRLLNTRREQDGMANLPAMLRAFAITEAPYVGVLNPLELTGVAGAAATPRLAVDEILAVGRLRIQPLRVLLRLLATNWFFEHHTGTLFTSDSFGWITDDAPADAAPQRAGFNVFGDSASTHPALMMGAKFDWLRGIDAAPILADLDAVMDRPIQRICPGMGRVIEGADAVRAAHATLRHAISRLAAQPAARWTMPAWIKETT